MAKSFQILFLVLLLAASCSRTQKENLVPGDGQHQKAKVLTSPNLLKAVEVFADTSCSKTLQEVMNEWSENSSLYTEDSDFYTNIDDDQSCFWTRLQLNNTDSILHTRVLYFPKGWQYLDAYMLQANNTYEKKQLGILKDREVLNVRVPPSDSTILYIRYPEKTKAYIPKLQVVEMSEETYMPLRSRSKVKYLLLGSMLFPILFFLVQFMVQKDKLGFYYLLFLIGSAFYLVTMLDTVPFFEMTPKIILSMNTIKHLFVISGLLTLAGLLKYIHIFLDVLSWSPKLKKTGDILIGVFALIALLPIVHTPIFKDENYSIYLQYYRVPALLVFVYIFILSSRAALKKIRFSGTLLLSFFPFMIGGIWYSLSFILTGSYAWLDMESLIMIVGFMLTMFLFGVVLGVRNNAVKDEKLRFEQRAERLRELDYFKSRFYTNITHEFRTPLTAIKGMASQIDKNEKIKKIVLRNTDRILNMVNQLLDLSKLETNSLTVNWVKGDVVPYLQYLTESCHSLAENRSLNLAFLSKEEKLVMDYDQDKLQHILINLLSNAIKFTPEYGSVKVITSRIYDSGTPYLELVVKDTGQGIPLDKQAHIFDRFYQVDDSNTRRVEGSGIGLAMVKELVKLLDGRIELKSALHKGSSFFVYLPIHQKARVKAVPDLTSPLYGTEDADIDQLSVPNGLVAEDSPLVLIIEDNADVTEYIVSCLKQDYQLLDAHNGKVGVEKALESIPDVILCDVMMPEMDGFEVCRRLKADLRTSHIPIVLLTSKASQEDKVAGLSHGADAYLTKPFDRKELLVRLTNLTAQSKLLKKQLSLGIGPDGDSGDPVNREATFLRELNKLIETNLHEEHFDTNYLCRLMAMSRTQLHRKLKALTDCSTANYIRTARLQKARSLLQTTDLTIGEISVHVGFKDFSHFTRSFTKEFGVNPSYVRN